MDNKFKKSKYAALVLASTMALSTVATTAPQAFNNNAITAQAATTETPAADPDVKSAADKTDFTIGETTYTVAVTEAETKAGTLKYKKNASDTADTTLNIKEGDTVELGGLKYKVTFNAAVDKVDAKAAGFYKEGSTTALTFPTTSTPGDKIKIGTTVYTYAQKVDASGDAPEVPAGYYDEASNLLSGLPADPKVGDTITIDTDVYTYAAEVDKVDAKEAGFTFTEVLPGASDVDNAITALDITKADYPTKVAAAEAAYKKLSSKDQKAVKKYKDLQGHLAIAKDADLIKAVKNLPAGTDIKKDDKFVYTWAADDTDSEVKTLTDKKGKSYEQGTNKKLEEKVTALSNFKTAYDKITKSTKETKTVLADKLKIYTAANKLVAPAQKYVDGVYNAQKFYEAYETLTGEQSSYEAGEVKLRVSKKGEFTVDGDKYIATKDDKGNIVVKDIRGQEVKPDKDTGLYNIKNSDELPDALEVNDAVSASGKIELGGKKGKQYNVSEIVASKKAVKGVVAGFYDAEDKVYTPLKGDTIEKGGKTYTYTEAVAADEKEAGFYNNAELITLNKGDTIKKDGSTVATYASEVSPKEGVEFSAKIKIGEETKTLKDGDLLEVDGITYEVSEGENTQLALSQWKVQPTYEEDFKVEFANNAFTVTQQKKASNIEDGINLLNLSKSMTVKEYKKLIAGKTKYSADQIRVIKGTETEAKALTANGKSVVSKEQTTNYKKYLADVKVQEALEKKLVTEETKAVSDKINKLKYTNAKAYRVAVEEAEYAYNELPAKYQKKIKAATIEKLNAQVAVLNVIDQIENLPVDRIVKAKTSEDINKLKAAADAVAKTNKADKVKGGSGTYYDLDKKQRSYVKNFKQIAAFNKAVTTQEKYVAQKTAVDTFETELTKVTGNVTLRTANDTIALGNQVFKIATDKKSKAITLTEVASKQIAEKEDKDKLTDFYILNETGRTYTIEAGKDLKLNEEALANSIEVIESVEVKEEGKEPEFKFATNLVNAANADIFASDGDTVTDKNGKTYKVVGISKEEAYLIEQVPTPLEKDADRTLASEKEIQLGTDKFEVTITDGTLSVKKNEKALTTLTNVEAQNGKKYNFELSTDKKSVIVKDQTPEFKGYVLTNTKGKLSGVERKNNTGLAVYSFKNISTTEYVKDTTKKYDVNDMKKINDANTALTTLNSNKNAKKYANKVDTTAVTAYQKAVKEQQKLEEKVLADQLKALAYNTDKVSDDTDAEYKYAVAVNEFETFYTNYKAKFPDTKSVTAIEKKYKDKLADQKAALEVAKKVWAIPAKDKLTKEDETKVTTARTEFDKLTKNQKKILANAEVTIKEAEGKIAELKASATTPSV